MQVQLLTLTCVTWYSRSKIQICLTLIKNTDFEIVVKDSSMVFVFIIQTITHIIDNENGDVDNQDWQCKECFIIYSSIDDLIQIAQKKMSNHDRHVSNTFRNNVKNVFKVLKLSISSKLLNNYIQEYFYDNLQITYNNGDGDHE